MRNFLLFFILAAAPALAQTPLNLTITGDNTSFLMRWASRVGSKYQVQVSANLQSWASSGIQQDGTGRPLQLQGATPSQRTFYRVVETDDPGHTGFLSKPLPDSSYDTIDGVGIAFDIPRLPSVPAKIRIFLRPVTTPASAWQQIGQITEFASKVRPPGTANPANPLEYFVPCTVVWIPDAAGDYEIKAEAVTAGAALIATATRLVHIGVNNPPVISFVTGPAAGTGPIPVEFTLEINDPDGDPVRKVEFYQDGLLIATDTTAPFGDSVIEVGSNNILELHKGAHAIHAKAYDNREGVGVTAIPWTVTVTGGNSRPRILSAALYEPPAFTGGNVTFIYTCVDPDGDTDTLIQQVAVVNDAGAALGADVLGPFTAHNVTANAAGIRPGPANWYLVAKDTDGLTSYWFPVPVLLNPLSGPFLGESLIAQIKGTGVTATNAQYTGQSEASDFFAGGLARGLRMDEGLVLTTGLASSWKLGDGVENMKKKWDAKGDPKLEERILGQSTKDAVVLECDLQSDTTQTTLVMQFGSEEYDEFVGLPKYGGCFNDAIMISLGGVIGTLTPDTDDLIALHTIHPLLTNADRNIGYCGALPHPEPALRGHLFLDDDIDILASQETTLPLERVEYDGMTIPLKIHFLAAPAASRKFRIAIADVNDDSLDSALFLKKASLTSTSVNP